MGITEPGSRGRVALVVLGLLAVGFAAALWLFTRPPPQLGTDPAVFATVDALFTAVTARDAGRVEECEGRLVRYREAGTLPPSAADELDRVIRMTRAGEWRAAAERLYTFMKGQRRDGRR